MFTIFIGGLLSRNFLLCILSLVFFILVFACGENKKPDIEEVNSPESIIDTTTKTPDNSTKLDRRLRSQLRKSDDANTKFEVNITCNQKITKNMLNLLKVTGFEIKSNTADVIIGSGDQKSLRLAMNLEFISAIDLSISSRK